MENANVGWDFNLEKSFHTSKSVGFVNDTKTFTKSWSHYGFLHHELSAESQVTRNVKDM